MTASVRYNGSSLLNLRSLQRGSLVLLGQTANPDQITFEELASALWFIETAVLSRKLYFDGSVPGKDVDVMELTAGKLGVIVDDARFSIQAVRPGQPDQLVRLSEEALQQAEPLLEHFQFDPAVDRPLTPDEHEAFYQVLQQAQTQTTNERASRAPELLDSPIRGGKLLAGLLAGPPHWFDRVWQLYHKLPEEGPRLSGGLINRFRLMLLNLIAEEVAGAYVPDPHFESVTMYHARLFKDYLLKRLLEQLPHGSSAPHLLSDNLRSETPLPPIGLYVLMSSTPHQHPVELLNTAFSKFQDADALRAYLWQHSQKGAHIPTDPAAAAKHHQELEAYFADQFRVMDQAAEGIRSLTGRTRTVASYVLPAMMGTVGGTLGTAGLGALAGLLVGVGVTVAAEVIGDRLKSEGHRSLLTQYKKIKWSLAHEPNLRQPLSMLGDRVAKVFGKKLVDAK